MRVLTKGIGKVDLTRIENYEAQGGYGALRKALQQMTPQDVHEEVKKANLRGRGGAGFPAGIKWGFLPDDGRPRYLACNGDESEPGTFNNRMLIEFNPHLLIEGILLAAYAVRASKSFIYLRGEFWKASGSERRHRAGRGERLFGRQHSRHGLFPGNRRPPRCRRLHLRRGNGPFELSRRRPWRAAH